MWPCKLAASLMATDCAPARLDDPEVSVSIASTPAGSPDPPAFPRPRKDSIRREDDL